MLIWQQFSVRPSGPIYIYIYIMYIFFKSWPMLFVFFINSSYYYPCPIYRPLMGILFRFSTLIARRMGPTWGPSGADRTQVGPMLATWTSLSVYILVMSLQVIWRGDIHRFSSKIARFSNDLLRLDKGQRVSVVVVILFPTECKQWGQNNE